MKKWTIDWLNTYSEVMISEELPSGIIMKKHFLKNPDEPNFWTKYFSTNSQLPFCPYTVTSASVPLVNGTTENIVKTA